jgi:hypothetical protein
MSDATRRQKPTMPPSATPLPDFPANLLEFQRMFPDEGACRRYTWSLCGGHRGSPVHL